MGTDISSLSLHHHGSPAVTSLPSQKSRRRGGHEGGQSKKLMIGLDRGRPGSSAAREGVCGKLPKETPRLAFHRFLCPLCASIRIGTTPNTVDSLDVITNLLDAGGFQGHDSLGDQASGKPSRPAEGHSWACEFILGTSASPLDLKGVTGRPLPFSCSPNFLPVCSWEWQSSTCFWVIGRPSLFSCSSLPPYPGSQGFPLSSSSRLPLS